MSFGLSRIFTLLVLCGLVMGITVTLQHSNAMSKYKQIISEVDHYRGAVSQFKYKYRALPGDFDNASPLWNTKDGDGDNKIGISSKADTHQEVMLFWQHLALARLIDGEYSGISGPGESGYHAIIGENVPASQYSGAGWSLHPDIGEAQDNKSRFDGYYGSYLFFGQQTDRAVTYGEILSANAMAGIDQKIDDGKPATGFMVAARPALSPNCVQGNDAAAIYRNSDELNTCHIVIKDVAGF